MLLNHSPSYQTMNTDGTRALQNKSKVYTIYQSIVNQKNRKTKTPSVIMNTEAMQKVYIAKIKDMKDYKIAEFIYN